MCKPGSESSPICWAGPRWRTWSPRPVSIHVCVLSCLVQPMVPCDSGLSPLDTIPSHFILPFLSPGLSPSVCALGFSLPLKGRKLLSLSISHLWSLTSLLSPLKVKPSRTAYTHGLLSLSFSSSGTQCNGASRKQVLSRSPEMPALPRRSPSRPCPVPPRQQLVALPLLQTLPTLTLRTPGSPDPSVPPLQMTVTSGCNRWTVLFHLDLPHSAPGCKHCPHTSKPTVTQCALDSHTHLQLANLHVPRSFTLSHSSLSLLLRPP